MHRDCINCGDRFEFDPDGPRQRLCHECRDRPGVVKKLADFDAYLEDGYSVYYAKVHVGWADPPE